MTQPAPAPLDDPLVNPNPGPDAPLFGVNIGPTEITIFLTMLASGLTLVFHKDWGLSNHVETIAAQAVYILPIVLGVLRTFKHFIATNNNAKVVVAQVAAGATLATTPMVMVPPPLPVSTDLDLLPNDTSIPDDIPVGSKV